jgi:hypothetical protein
MIPAENMYRLTDVQNFRQGKPLTGKYNGSIKIKMNGLNADVPIGLKETPAMVMPEHTDARFGVYWLEYFPYSLRTVIEQGTITCLCYDVSDKIVKNPLLLSFEWKKDGKTIKKSFLPGLKLEGDGTYELLVTDDKGLTRQMSFTVSGGKLVEKK